MAVSKTKMTSLVRTFAATDVDAALETSPDLAGVRDGRGRNWLHLCCGVDVRGKAPAAEQSVRTAGVLLAHGLDLGAEAFTEDAWKATPLWFAIALRPQSPARRVPVGRGCDPDTRCGAAAFNDDLEAIDLLVGYGAIVDDPSVPDETPFLSAVKVSHFPPAGRLLDHGADVNVQDPKGMTALHYMLKKQSDKVHFEMLIAHGACGDIRNREGLTAVDIMRKKRDPDFHELADRLR